MAKKFVKKETKFRGLLNDSESSVSSFLGRINSGSVKHYIGVEVPGEWLTLPQAKRLQKLLGEHIERVEAAKGVSVMSGSKRYRKKQATNTVFVGYSDQSVSRFLSDVEKLAKSHFVNWEYDYKWKALEGQKTDLVMDFRTWVSAFKMGRVVK